MTEPYILFTFDTTHGALCAQAALFSLSPYVMPTLRAIRASCGMSLRLPPEKRGEAEAIMAASDVSWELWRVDGQTVEKLTEGRP